MRAAPKNQSGRLRILPGFGPAPALTDPARLNPMPMSRIHPADGIKSSEVPNCCTRSAKLEAKLLDKREASAIARYRHPITDVAGFVKMSKYLEGESPLIAIKSSPRSPSPKKTYRFSGTTDVFSERGDILLQHKFTEVDLKRGSG